MARLCIPGNRNVKFTRDPDGNYNSLSLATDSEKHYLMMHDSIVNSTQLMIQPSVDKCIKSLQLNESDIVIAPVHPDEDAYTVPATFSSSTADFITGLNLSRHSELLEKPEVKKHGVLSNSTNFTVPIYAIIALFIITFISLIYLSSHLMKMRLSIIGRRKNKTVARIFLFYCRYFAHPRVSHLRNVCLLILVFYFLSITPFLLMFKTNQLVFKVPRMIDSYEQVIDSRATVFVPWVSSNASNFLVPYRDDMNSIVNRFWFFFRQMERAFDVSAKLRDFSKIMSFMDQLTNGRCIFLSSSLVIQFYQALFCSLAINSDQQIALLLFHDPHQRSEIQGFAFRIGYINLQVVQLYKRLFEMQTLDHFSGEQVKFLSQNLIAGASASSRFDFEMCVKPTMPDSRAFKFIPPGDLSIFTSLFLLVLMLYCISAVILSLEHLIKRTKVTRKTPIRRRSTVKFSRKMR